MNIKYLSSQLIFASAAGAFQPAWIMAPTTTTIVRTFGATTRTAPLSLAMMSPDYYLRASMNKFDPPATIVDALKPQPNTKTYVLDVRGPDEIAQSKLTVPKGITWVTTPCTKASCPELLANPTKFLPDKDATIVVHCASGIRANTAKETLESLGYTKVLNAGGLNDILAYSKNL